MEQPICRRTFGVLWSLLLLLCASKFGALAGRLDERFIGWKGESYQSAGSATGSKLKVILYEESLCPDSRGYLQQIMTPLFDNGLSDFMDFRMVACGHVKKDAEGHLVCQNGKGECYLNKIFDCAMEFHPEQNDWFPFVSCIELHAGLAVSNETFIDVCAKKAGLKSDQIFECAKGTLGDELLKEACEETDSLSPQLIWVPWVLVDGIPTYNGMYYLQTFICLTIPEKERPSDCFQNPDQSVSMDAMEFAKQELA